MNNLDMFRANGALYPADRVKEVDLEGLEDLSIVVHFFDGETAHLEDVDTIDFLMKYQPFALEGRRLRWAKRAWRIHNYLGHPLMQLFSEFGLYRLGMWFHDSTVPRPEGQK